MKNKQGSHWGTDLTAGLTTAIANIPDALCRGGEFCSDAGKGKLMLAGISDTAYDQLYRAETTDDILGAEDVF